MDSLVHDLKGKEETSIDEEMLLVFISLRLGAVKMTSARAWCRTRPGRRSALNKPVPVG